MTITDPARLEALHHFQVLLASGDNDPFDRSARLAAACTKAPAALISLLDDERQIFISQIGLPQKWAAQGSMPLDYSLCREVIESGSPLVVDDVRRFPDLAANVMNARAYVSVPLKTSRGYVIGAVAVFDTQPRVWKADETNLIAAFADGVIAELERRASSAALVAEQQAQVERISHLEKMKSEMIRVVAHDLRNPLGLVMGYSELLLEEGDQMAAHHRDFIALIHRSGRKMLTLINDILSLERLTAARDANHQRLSFIELARNVYETNRDSATHNGLKYQFEALESNLATIGDEAELREAMENLISNGIKYTPEGGTVIVRVKRQGDMVNFQVEDTGYGVPENEQSRLFQPFFRSHAEETYKIGGTGLGLHLVKNIVERHSGEVAFKSVYGKGSTFGFYLHGA